MSFSSHPTFIFQLAWEIPSIMVSFIVKISSLGRKRTKDDKKLVIALAKETCSGGSIYKCWAMKSHRQVSIELSFRLKTSTFWCQRQLFDHFYLWCLNSSGQMQAECISSTIVSPCTRGSLQQYDCNWRKLVCSQLQSFLRWSILPLWFNGE